jgi:hypothetical protein
MVLEERCDAQQYMLGWLLHRAGEDAYHLLSDRANELDQNPKNDVWVTEFDELREELAKWRSLEPVP